MTISLGILLIYLAFDLVRGYNLQKQELRTFLITNRGFGNSLLFSRLFILTLVGLDAIRI